MTMKLSDKVQCLRNWEDIDNHCSLNKYSIVKYRPEFYDEHGVYMKDEWTSVSDIGNIFDGEELTKDQYLEVENAYISTVKELVAAAGCKYLSVVGIEDYGLRRAKAFNNENKAMYQIVSQYTEGHRLSVNDIDYVMKLCLREQYWCILANGRHNVQLDVGYEYYLHFYSLLPVDFVKAIVRKNNLYIARDRK